MKTVVNELTDGLKAKFDNLLNAMSPENVSCDGELSDAEVNRARASLRKRWRTLEKKAGRKVSEDEAWNFGAQLKKTAEWAKHPAGVIPIPEIDPKIGAMSLKKLVDSMKKAKGAAGDLGAVAEVLIGEGFLGK